ncbi:MAG: response regulator, partial [Burkholderiales bacterium]
MNAVTRVLLVEDDEADAALTLASLKGSGLNISHQRVWSRADLAKSLAQQSWDVVLCDHNLPQFDGLSALTMVKAHDPDIPFIIVSGAIGEETAVAAMRRGAQDFVMKHSLGRLGAVIIRELGDTDIRRSARLAAHNLQANEA